MLIFFIIYYTKVQFIYEQNHSSQEESSQLFPLKKNLNDKPADYCQVPIISDNVIYDRRLNKTRLVIVEYNAEWLFIRGGKGSIRCPSKSCPWSVKIISHLVFIIIYLHLFCMFFPIELTRSRGAFKEDSKSLE